MDGVELKPHRGKTIIHNRFVVEFHSGEMIKVFVPHYFESIGTERKLTKDIENYKLKIRSKKIINIKRKIT